MLSDRLAQREDPEAVGVASATVLERSLESLPDHEGRLEVGLAKLQMDHVDASSLQRLGTLTHLDGQEGLDLLDAPREPHRPLQMRNRARTIWFTIPGP